MKTTLNKIRIHRPCQDGWEKLLKGLGKTSPDDEVLELTEVLRLNGLPDAIWCLRAIPNAEFDIKHFALWCAKEVAHLMTSEARNLLEAMRRFPGGVASKEEMGDTRTAAAAYVAAAAYAADAADAAAYDAAYAADAAAYAAAYAATDATDAVAYVADAAAYASDAADAAAYAAAYADAADADAAAAADADAAAAAAAAYAAAAAAAKTRQQQMFVLMCQGEAPWQMAND